MSKIKDYIILETDEFEKKHGEEAYDDTRELARRQEFNSSLVVPQFREKREKLIEDGSTEVAADKAITRILKRKAFSEQFINRYVEALKGPKISGFKDLIESFDIKYYGKPLTANDLEEELNVGKLVICLINMVLIHPPSQQKPLTVTLLYRKNWGKKLFLVFVPSVTQ